MSRRDVLDLRDYLEHMLQASDRVQRYLDGMDRVGFLADELRQDAVLRNFEVLGEAAWNVHRHFPDVVAGHPGIQWKAMYGMRNVLAHGYFRIDLDAVWEAATSALPATGTQVRELLDSLPCTEDPAPPSSSI